MKENKHNRGAGQRHTAGRQSNSVQPAYQMDPRGFPVDEFGVRIDRPGYREIGQIPENEPPEQAGQRKKKKKHSPVGIFFRIVAVVAALAVVLAGGGIFYLWTMLGRVNYEQVELETVAGAPVSSVYDPAAYTGQSVDELPLMGDTDDVTNILLLGIDSESFEGRADTNMILSINKASKTIKMVSLLRDTWVTIPGRDADADGWDDEDRLNAAYAYGGASLQIQMIEQNFRLHIDKYITVNFDAFPKVIDALGGVDVPCRGDEAARVPAAGTTVRYGGSGFVPAGTTDGTYHFDGYQALQYARIRYLDADGDFSRTDRQRKLMSIVIEKAKDMNIFQLNDVLCEALPQVRTNMSRTTFMGYSLSALRYAGYEIDTSYRVPQDGLWEYASIQGMSVLRLTDKVQTVRELHQYIYSE